MLAETCQNDYLGLHGVNAMRRNYTFLFSLFFLIVVAYIEGQVVSGQLNDHSYSNAEARAWVIWGLIILMGLLQLLIVRDIVLVKENRKIKNVICIIFGVVLLLLSLPLSFIILPKELNLAFPGHPFNWIGAILLMEGVVGLVVSKG